MSAEHLSVKIYYIRAGRAKSVTKLWAGWSRVGTQEEESDFDQLQNVYSLSTEPTQAPFKKYEGSDLLGRESGV
jgi:hypothetical protein